MNISRSIIAAHSYVTISKRYFSASIKNFNKNVPTYKIAIVGTGPAGFYTAHHLLHKAAPLDQFKLKVDFFERLPAPYGLSRYGVAPDHPEVKNCEDYLNNIMQDYPAKKDNNTENKNHEVRFFGNINIGEDITLEELESSYHSIILSYGCTSDDNQLNIPGAQLPGVIAAREFVHWYNGHPDYHSADTQFIPPQLDKIEDVTIIGNGNVALDVARILLAEPQKHWSSTDISKEALEALFKSSVKNVNIVARRGILESAFSNKEIRELLELSKDQKVRFLPIEDSIMESIQPMVNNLGRIDKRRVALLEKYSKQSPEVDSSMKTWSLKYLRTPVEFTVNESSPDLLLSTRFQKNELIQDLLTNKIQIKPIAGEFETIKNELVILSIGYKGSPLVGFEEAEISFDTHHNRLLNKEGRILSTSASGEDLHNLIYKRGWYTSGWIKNGPKGVIATTMMESFETADNVLEDLSNSIHTNPLSDSTSLEERLKAKPAVSWEDWLKLEQLELNNGTKFGKSRDKLSNTAEMLKVACK